MPSAAPEEIRIPASTASLPHVVFADPLAYPLDHSPQRQLSPSISFCRHGWIQLLIEPSSSSSVVVALVLISIHLRRSLMMCRHTHAHTSLPSPYKSAKRPVACSSSTATCVLDGTYPNMLPPSGRSRIFAYSYVY